MKGYIDNEYKIHCSNSVGTYMEVELPECFNGKCTDFIEGFRFVPSGKSWTRSDGVVFQGEMIAPWMPFSELDAAQREYERHLLAEYEAALSEIEKALGV